MCIRDSEYISARVAIPQSWSYAALRRFHSAAAVTMISTASLAAELAQRGFKNLRMWTRGVDTGVFTPAEPFAYDLPRPIFVSVGRVAVEKNLEAFLSLDLPGSKVVIGDGPQESELRKRFPEAHFLGVKEGKTLASYLAGADVFVFPSRTDTFGIVQLEALACGTPVAAFPVTGPNDVITSEMIGALDNDLRAACLRALGCLRSACRDYALGYSWENSARQFVSHLTPLRAGLARGTARRPGVAKMAERSRSKPSFPMG